MIPALRAVCGEQHRYVTSVFRYLPSSRPASIMRAHSLEKDAPCFCRYRGRSRAPDQRRLPVGSCCRAALGLRRASPGQPSPGDSGHLKCGYCGQAFYSRSAATDLLREPRVGPARLSTSPRDPLHLFAEAGMFLGGIQSFRGARHRRSIRWEVVSQRVERPLTRFSPLFPKEKHPCAAR